jgi:splicing factor 3B subunit 1
MSSGSVARNQLLSKLGPVLFEQLGEEYPDTLGSIIAAEGAITNVVAMTQMNPPVKDLCEFSNVYEVNPFTNPHDF